MLEPQQIHLNTSPKFFIEINLWTTYLSFPHIFSILNQSSWKKTLTFSQITVNRTILLNWLLVLNPSLRTQWGKGMNRSGYWSLQVWTVTNSAFSYTLQNVYYFRSFNWPISYASQSLWQNIGILNIWILQGTSWLQLPQPTKPVKPTKQNSCIADISAQ